MPAAARRARAATDPPPADREGADGRPGSQETCLRPQARKTLVERGWLVNLRNPLPSAPLAPGRAQAGALVVACLLACGVACAAAAPALAGTPSAVSVRVEGLAETKLTATSVTTTAAPVVKDGNPAHAC